MEECDSGVEARGSYSSGDTNESRGGQARTVSQKEDKFLSCEGAYRTKKPQSKPESESVVRERRGPGRVGKALIMSNLGKPWQSLDFIVEGTRKPLTGSK